MPFIRDFRAGPLTGTQTPALCGGSTARATCTGLCWDRQHGAPGTLRPALAWARGPAGSGSSAPGVSTGYFPSSQEEEEDGLCASVRSSSGRAAGLLWSRRSQEGLWPRGSAFYGAVERTQLAAVVTHTPQRGPGPGHPSPLPIGADQGTGWIRAGSRSLAVLGGLRHLQAQLRPRLLSQDSPWVWGAPPRDGREGDGVFPRTRRARGCLPGSFPLLRLPSRHMARSPCPGSGSGRQTATAGLLLPARQEGTRRAGWLLRAPACAPGVSPRSRALPGESQPAPRGRFGAKAEIFGSPVCPSSGCRPQRSAVGDWAGPGAGRRSGGRGVGWR